MLIYLFVCYFLFHFFRMDHTSIELQEAAHVPKYVCEEDGRSYSTRKALYNHMKTKHEDFEISCDMNMCEGIFSSKRELAIHKKSKHNKNLATCEKCQKSFSTKTNLNRHVNAEHEKKLKPKKILVKLTRPDI